ncbi:TonB-dependent receptor [Sphingomonas canadensis]|uniref:TonB-dependent receptor n=1 Tax=Sphingomonas canadensis TaxID=1219257 RepID=A0ABW3H9C5_9SPHN|nr:TonB-dependent receptor [Sphingomonas canadensis]MCW3835634.1 TonB-dependent receptor [Sphingomonas canadensis]
MIRTISALSASLLALTYAQAAYAQPSAQEEPAQSGAGAEEGQGLDDIVVTATRQETNLQSTPVTITAVTSELLEQRGLANAADLGSVIPNASFRRSQGVYGPGMSAFIRGIGTVDTSLAGEPAVAFYVDDVYYPLLFGSMFDLLELDHVEVLRGPQGTLFGRNALAGAINIVSKAPSLDETSGYFQASAGNYDLREVRAGINMPIAENVAIAISGLYKERRGYQRRLDFRCEMIRRGTPELAGNFPFQDANLINGSHLGAPDDCTIGYQGGEDVNAIRGQLRWEPASNLSITFTADWLKDRSEVPADSLLTVDPAISAARPNVTTLFNTWTRPGGPTFAYDTRFVTGDPYTTYATFADPVAAGTAIPGNQFYNGSPFRGGVRNPTESPFNSWGFSGKAVYTVAPDIDVILVAGYREIAATYAYDVDASPVAMENNRNDVDHWDWTGELRVAGSRDWIDWVVGLFYYNGEGNQRFTGTSPYNNTLRSQNNNYKPTSKAVYANTTLRPFEGLGVTLGGRYSDDSKGVDFYTVLDGTNASSTSYTIAPTGSTIFVIDLSEKRFDWKVGLDYKLADRTMIFASAATGFRLPGFNSRPFQASQVGQYPGEEIVTYELGIKTDLFDRRLRVNATGFYTDYKTRITSTGGAEYLLDASGNPVPGNQVQVPGGTPGTTLCQPAPVGTPGYTCTSRTFFLNTPGKVKGFEAEIDARPIDGLSISATVGYSKFSSADLDARPATSNKRLANIPEWTASAGIQYEIPFPMLKGSITPRLDWFYTGSMQYSITRLETNQPGYSTFNGRLTYNNDDEDFSVSLGVVNLFNNFYWRNFFVYKDIGFPQINAQPAPPRQWSLTVSKRF